mgnify:CR=1 FL=1
MPGASLYSCDARMDDVSGFESMIERHVVSSKLSKGILMAIGLVVVSASVAIAISVLGGSSGEDTLTVAEVYQSLPGSTERIRVAGRITDEGIDLERYAFAEFSLMDVAGDDRELPVSFDRTVFTLSDDLQANIDVIVVGHLRGKVLEASEILLEP